MKLYSYFRSSAAYRVRIALNMKGVDCQQVPVNLRDGEQISAGYLTVNPAGLVPSVVSGEGKLYQSLAIIEWLEEQYPQPSLLPSNGWDKAQVRSMAYTIACDIHPLNNLRVLSLLKDEYSVDDPTGESWYHHWIHRGFSTLEQQVEASDFCIGITPTLADICLVPQVYNALRFNVDMTNYPKITNIWNHCSTLDAFDKAKPENQPDCI